MMESKMYSLDSALELWFQSGSGWCFGVTSEPLSKETLTHTTWLYPARYHNLLNSSESCSFCLLTLPHLLPPATFSLFFVIPPMECDLWWPWPAHLGILHTWRDLNRALGSFHKGHFFSPAGQLCELAWCVYMLEHHTPTAFPPKYALFF